MRWFCLADGICDRRAEPGLAEFRLIVDNDDSFSDSPGNGFGSATDSLLHAMTGVGYESGLKGKGK